MLLQLVAKGLLTDYRDEFGSLDALGMVRFVTGQVIETVVERTAARKLIQALIDAVPGREEETDLLDRRWHLDLFEWREEHVIDGLARRIRGGVNAGRAQVTALLNTLCDLHALASIEADQAWFLEHGRLSAPGSKAVTAEVSDLCRTLRPSTPPLVDAFGVPDEAIGAPIALGDEDARQEVRRKAAGETGTFDLNHPPA